MIGRTVGLPNGEPERNEGQREEEPKREDNHATDNRDVIDHEFGSHDVEQRRGRESESS